MFWVCCFSFWSSQSQEGYGSYKTRNSHFDIATATRTRWYRKAGHFSRQKPAKSGKMNVLLGAMSGAFKGVNASTITIELGSHIQRIAPYDKPTWVMVDEGTREQKFDFSEWKTDQVVKKAVHKLAIHVYKEFRSCLHREYKQLQSQRNSMSRRQVQMTHTSGSQSFPQWLSLTPVEEVPSSQAELYRQQHWSKKKNKWITTHAEATYQRLELGLSQSEVSISPVARQQLIEDVLGKRVARRKGYRSRGPASISSSTAVASEMSNLQQQLAESQRAQEEL